MTRGRCRGERSSSPCAQVDPLVADENRDLALEDVERLVLVAMDVTGGRVPARAVDSICAKAGRSRRRLL